MPQTVSNTYAQVAKAQLCANHVQHIERFSHTACHVPHDTKGQFEITFMLALFHRLKPLTNEGGRGGGGWGGKLWWRKPLTTSFRKCHMPKPEIQAPTKTRTFTRALVLDRKADMLIIAPSVTPTDLVGFI